MKHITIKDIAKELNLAVSTISRAFNEKYDIHPDTRRRILEKAQQMGYRPNPIAKKLLQQKSMNIGIVIPEFINCFFPEVIIGAQEVFFREGYQTLITQSNECYQNELQNVKLLYNNMVDGFLISLTHETKNIDYYKELVESGVPMVFFNRINEELKTSRVVFDDYRWSYFATEHLIFEGYKKIYHFSGPQHLFLSQKRITGFLDALKKHRMSLVDNKILPADFTIIEGEKVANQLIQTNDIPDAIFASGDLTAIGAMRTFKANGYRVPDDIAFVGFSEGTLANYVDPPLTSVAQPTFDIGRAAASLLLEQINNSGVFVPQTITLNGKLNIRGSSIRLTKS